MDASQVVPDVAQVNGPTFCEAFPMWGFPVWGDGAMPSGGVGAMPFVTPWSGLYALGIGSLPNINSLGP